MSKCKCPECGRTVSSDALFCPHCGCPGSRIKSNASGQTIIGLIVFAVIIIAVVTGNKDEDKSKEAETEEQTIEIVTNEVNKTPKLQSMDDNEYVNPSYAKDEEAISDDEIIESPEFDQVEIFESIVNEEFDNNIDITE